MTTQQLTLPLRTPTLPCAFGLTGEDWDGPHHCAACAAAVADACRWCAAERAAGRYDADLYTPAEAKAARTAGTYLARREAA